MFKFQMNSSFRRTRATSFVIPHAHERDLDSRSGEARSILSLSKGGNDGKALNPRHGAKALAGMMFAAGLGLLLAGCPSNQQTTESAPPPVAQAAAFHGVVFGGRQPIAGSTVVAYAASTTAGAVPTEIGTAVSDSSGKFTMTFSPAPASGEVVYAVVSGGNAGAGVNSAIGLMTIAGIQGSTLAPVAQTVNVNELTTVASTAALQDYIQFVDCATITGTSQAGTCVSIPGALDLAHMAATVNNLVNVETGKLSDFLASQATTNPDFEQTLAKMNTLANVLAGCVNTSGTVADPSGACKALFDAALGNPSDTLRAAWLAAASPVVNARGDALFALQESPTTYTPALTAAPANWTVGGQRYAYVANSNGNDVSAWRLGVRDGSLDVLTGSPFVVGSNAPTSVAVDPTGRYAYVANFYDGVSEYTINADGTLTANDTIGGTGHNPILVVVDPTGRYVYVANYYGGVSEYTINADGTLTANGTIGAGTNPESVAVDPTGRYVYVANDGGGGVSEYMINAGGTLTANGTIDAGTNPESVAVDPTGRYVYVANYGSGDVSGYTINADGTLTANGTIGAGTNPESVAVDPTGRYVYVANYSGGVSEYTINAGGTLTANGTIDAGYGPNSVAVDPTGHYVYVANYSTSSNNVSLYTINADGTLTANGTIGAGTNPESVAVDPTGRYVYVANFGSGNVSAYTIGVGGAPTPITTGGAIACANVSGTNPNNCFAAGMKPLSVTMDPTGRYVYVANADADNVSEYVINTDGTLAANGSIGAGDSPSSVAMDPAGRYAYVANQCGDDTTCISSGTVSAYAIGTDGRLASLGTATPTGAYPSSVTVDPSGRYAYVANQCGDDTTCSSSGTVSAYAIGTDGRLVSLGTATPTGAYPYSVAMDPSGRYAYVANQCGDDTTCSSSGTVSAYAIGTDGALTAIGTIAAGTNPFSVAVDPSGRYAYVANYDDDTVSAYTIGTDGTLTANGSPNTIGAGIAPISVAVDPTGRYVYVTNQGSGDNVSMYTIDADGTLTELAGSPFDAGSGPYSIVIGP